MIHTSLKKKKHKDESAVFTETDDDDSEEEEVARVTYVNIILHSIFCVHKQYINMYCVHKQPADSEFQWTLCTQVLQFKQL